MTVYVVEFLEEGMELMFQIHSVTSSEEYAITISSMLQDRDDILEAGYSAHELIEMPSEV